LKQLLALASWKPQASWKAQACAFLHFLRIYKVVNHNLSNALKDKGFYKLVKTNKLVYPLKLK
jgi:hypothetical protein